MRISSTVLVGAAFVAVAAACASTGSNGGGASEPRAAAPVAADPGGGSLWDRLDAARAARTARAGSDAFDPNAGADSVAPSERAKYEGWWATFVRGDDRWSESRAAWLAAPAPGPQILAENLLRRHVLAYDAGDRTEYERTKREILLLPDVATPLLLAGLARGAGDAVVRRHAIDLLAAFGPPAVPAIVRAADEAGPKGRTDLVRSLARMKDRATTAPLAKIARGGGAFEPRIEAVKGLAENGDPAGFSAVAACLEDDDPSVRKFAARYAGGYGRPETPGLLVACLERCESAKDREGVAEVHAALKALTRLDPPAESGAWRAVLRRAGLLGTGGR